MSKAFQTTPACKSGRSFLRTNGHPLGALTGQDGRALSAILHCLELYACSDEDGERAALDAIRALLKAMQPGTRGLAKAAIPFALDWSAEDNLWAKILSPRCPTPGEALSEKPAWPPEDDIPF